MNKTNGNTLKKRIAIIAAAGALAGAIGVGASLAYLTDNEIHTNTFTVGNVRINLEEPSWSTDDANKNGVPDAAENIVPNQQIAKDPKISNEGVNDAVVFMRVTVPVKDVTKVANNGTTELHKPQEVFYFEQKDDAIAKESNNFVTTERTDGAGSWVELPTKEYAPENPSAEGQRTYVFGYSKVLEQGESTDCLFDKIQAKNILENEIASTEMQNIKVEGWAIQADNLVGASAADIIGDATTLDETKLNEIYDLFVKQNGTISSTGDMTYTTAANNDHALSTKESDINNTKNLHGEDTVTTTISASVGNPRLMLSGDSKSTTMTVTFNTKAASLNDETLTYTSNNSSVATVTGSGKTATITAVGAGDATITAKTADGAAAAVHISVEK